MVICDFPYDGPDYRRIVPCGAQRRPRRPRRRRSSTAPRGPRSRATHARRCSEPQAVQIARQDYSDYQTIFLYPSISLMIKTGLWIELEATIGFIVGLGLGSLLGQRTVAVILMIDADCLGSAGFDGIQSIAQRAERGPKQRVPPHPVEDVP